MKKVKHIFSSDKMKVFNKKFAAVFSATAIAFTSLTFTVHYSTDATASTNMKNGLGRQEILELSESFSSFNAEKKGSVVELAGVKTPESESVIFEELSTGSESNSEVTTEKTTEKAIEKTTEVKTEVATKAPETTTKAVEITTTVSNTVAEDVSRPDGAYTFSELGLTQISDIPVPDDILFDENGVPLNYSRKLTGKSTAYCMGHTTATGTSVHEGVVAVDPRIIPYGSKMYIVSMTVGFTVTALQKIPADLFIGITHLLLTFMSIQQVLHISGATEA